MRTIKYYLPIKAENLAHYFSRALICPAKYIFKRNSDVQSIYDNILLLSSKQAILDTDCSLEIVLTNEEISELVQLSIDCWSFAKPLPITRIKEILFTNRVLMKNIISLIETNTAFVPSNLLKVVNKFNIAILPKNKGVSQIDWSDKIRSYNQILGGLALMRLVTRDGMNYSENYFSMLSRYNNIIKRELKNANKEIKTLYRGGYYDYLNNCITKNVDEVVLEDIAKKEGQTIIRNKYTRTVDLENLDNASYIMAILTGYKVADNDIGRINIDGLIINRFLNIKKGEEVAFYYGLNRGYSVFTKKYKDVEFKYCLDSLLDYYTIESLYQKNINGVDLSAEFPYLENWCPKKMKKANVKLVVSPNYIVLDTIVLDTIKPKVGSNDYWKNLCQDFREKTARIVFGMNVEDIYKEIVNRVSIDKDAEKTIPMEPIFNTNNKHIVVDSDFYKKIEVLEKENKELKMIIKEKESQIIKLGKTREKVLIYKKKKTENLNNDISDKQLDFDLQK
nr:hypothetical protein [uncultured Bacteroides sp.]